VDLRERGATTVARCIAAGRGVHPRDLRRATTLDVGATVDEAA
jgi:hypothetical protein